MNRCPFDQFKMHFIKSNLDTCLKGKLPCIITYILKQNQNKFPHQMRMQVLGWVLFLSEVNNELSLPKCYHQFACSGYLYNWTMAACLSTQHWQKS